MCILWEAVAETLENWFGILICETDEIETARDKVPRLGIYNVSVIFEKSTMIFLKCSTVFATSFCLIYGVLFITFTVSETTRIMSQYS